MWIWLIEDDIISYFCCRSGAVITDHGDRLADVWIWLIEDDIIDYSVYSVDKDLSACVFG